jgi:two-component system sensor histidine kinase KdpD
MLDLELAGAPVAVRYAFTVGMIVFATFVAIALDTAVTIPNLSLVFVLPVVAAAVMFGIGPSIFAAIMGALAFNFFLTEPRYSLAVDDPANIWAIGLLFVVGCIASTVAATSRRRADDAALRSRQADALNGLARAVRSERDVGSILEATADTLQKLFGAPTAALVTSGEKIVASASRGNLAMADSELAAARSTAASGDPSMAGVYPADASRFDFWSASIGGNRSVVVGLAFEENARPSKPGTLAEIAATLAALAIAQGEAQIRQAD